MEETLQELQLQALVKEKELILIRSRIAAYQIKNGNDNLVVELDKKIAAKQLEVAEQVKP